MRIQGQNNILHNDSMKLNKKMNTGNHQDSPLGVQTFSNESYIVTISDQGAKSYRENLHSLEHYEPQELEDRTEWKDLLSKSVVDITGQIQSDLHSRFTGLNTKTGRDECKAGDFAENLLSVYADMYDEIIRGYADGTREIWVIDETSENGFRKVTEKEELAALDEAMDFQAMVVDGYLNYGREAGRKAREAIERTQADFANQEYREKSYEEKEKGIENMYRELLKSSRAIKQQYSIYADNLPFLVQKAMKENLLIQIITKEA